MKDGLWTGAREFFYTCCRRHSVLIAKRLAAEEGFLCTMFSFTRNDLLPNSVLQNVTAFTPCRASHGHFSWRPGCSGNVVAVLRTHTAPRRLLIGVQCSDGV